MTIFCLFVALLILPFANKYLVHDFGRWIEKQIPDSLIKTIVCKKHWEHY